MRTLTTQRTDDTEVTLKHASLGNRYFLHITRVAGGDLRRCPRALVRLDQRAYRFRPDYRASSVKGRVVEREPAAGSKRRGRARPRDRRPGRAA